MTPIGGGFMVDPTLNHCLQPDAEMLLCRFTGAAWDCAQDLSTSTTITRVGVTQLDDWAMGSVSAWSEVQGLC